MKVTHIQPQKGIPRFRIPVSGSKLAMDYGFRVLNLYKLYLIVDKENKKAIHIYVREGFVVEGELIHEFFINGRYRNAVRMCIFQSDYLAGMRKNNGKETGDELA